MQVQRVKRQRKQVADGGIKGQEAKYSKEWKYGSSVTGTQRQVCRCMDAETMVSVVSDSSQPNHLAQTTIFVVSGRLYALKPMYL